mmetsp:Transcript_5634/g.10169  ORF Transcript_5634/g.10169 Transcript_5634/m.10169 type:complete len:211 (+) Transcript_5634:1285-1917(+)
MDTATTTAGQRPGRSIVLRPRQDFRSSDGRRLRNAHIRAGGGILVGLGRHLLTTRNDRQRGTAVMMMVFTTPDGNVHRTRRQRRHTCRQHTTTLGHNPLHVLPPLPFHRLGNLGIPFVQLPGLLAFVPIASDTALFLAFGCRAGGRREFFLVLSGGFFEFAFGACGGLFLGLGEDCAVGRVRFGVGVLIVVIAVVIFFAVIALIGTAAVS